LTAESQPISRATGAPALAATERYEVERGPHNLEGITSMVVSPVDVRATTSPTVIWRQNRRRSAAPPVRRLSRRPSGMRLSESSAQPWGHYLDGSVFGW